MSELEGGVNALGEINSAWEGLLQIGFPASTLYLCDNTWCHVKQGGRKVSEGLLSVTSAALKTPEVCGRSAALHQKGFTAEQS